MKLLPPDLADARREGVSKALQTSDLGPLTVEGQGLPAFATLNGQQVAILALDAYRTLLAAALQGVARPPARRATAGPPLGLSTIERDPEVADFIRSRFRGGVTVAQIRDACCATFGDERTPSHARIQRFRGALKAAR